MDAPVALSSDPAADPLSDPLARRLWRWGLAGAVAVFAALLAATFGLAVVVEPVAAFAVPVVVVAIGGVLVAVRRPGMSAALAVVCGLLLSGIADDIPAGKGVFGLYVGGFMASWYLARWAAGERFVVSRTDVGAALLLVLGVVLGLTVGVGMRNKPAEMLTQFQAFFPILLYFPLKHVCARVRSGPEIIAGAVVVLGMGAAVQNAVVTQQALSSATELWQIIDVRTAYGEIMLLASTLLVTAFLVSATERREVVLFLGLFGVSVIGLILTKSRGFWVATLLSGLVLLAVSDGSQRRKLLVAGTLGGAALTALAFAVAGPYVVLIATGIVKRFSTISTASSADISLVNRFVESAGAWAKIRQNPILGYGWGATYSYFSVLSGGTQTWGFVHNAYLGVWLKTGLWGLGLTLWVWIGATVAGVRAVRDRRLTQRHRAIAGAAGASLVGIALVATTSSPFELADQTLVLTTLWAIAQGTAQRASARPKDAG